MSGELNGGRRHRIGRLLDRVVTPILGLAGRLVERPSDELLSESSGRLRGGRETLSAVDSLEAGRRALSNKDYSEALLHFSSAIERDEGLAWAWHGRGDAFLLAGRPASALACFDRALALEPESALAQLGRGNAHEKLGHRSEAREAWETALTLDPELDWAKEGLKRLNAAK